MPSGPMVRSCLSVPPLGSLAGLSLLLVQPASIAMDTRTPGIEIRLIFISSMCAALKRTAAPSQVQITCHTGRATQSLSERLPMYEWRLGSNARSGNACGGQSNVPSKRLPRRTRVANGERCVASSNSCDVRGCTLCHSSRRQPTQFRPESRRIELVAPFSRTTNRQAESAVLRRVHTARRLLRATRR